MFKLACNAKIFVINGIDDVRRMPMKRFMDWRMMVVDWEQMRNQYSGVFLTEKGNRELHSYDNIDLPNFNSWDMESICVFHKQAIKPIEPQNNPEI